MREHDERPFADTPIGLVNPMISRKVDQKFLLRSAMGSALH
jgi:hypothetical protein